MKFNIFICFACFVYMCVSVNTHYNECSVYIALIQPNINLVENLVLNTYNPNSDQYKQHLSYDEFTQLISIDSHIVKEIIDWVSHYNIYNCLNVYDSLVCQTPCTNIIQISDKQYVIQGMYKLHSNISFIITTGNASIARFSPIYTNKLKSDSIPYVNRNTLSELYNFTIDNSSNNFESIAVIEFGSPNGYSMKDLDKQNLYQDIDGVNVTNLNELGLKYYGIENELDIQTVVLGAYKYNLSVFNWEVQGWIYEWLIDYQIRIKNNQPIPYINSVSYGWNEQDQQAVTHFSSNMTSEMYVQRCNYEFAKLSYFGITFVIASGDTGSPQRTNPGCQTNIANPISPLYPGCSPWVLSVGATFQKDPKITNDGDEWCTNLGCIVGDVSQTRNINYNEMALEGVRWTSGGGCSFYSNVSEFQLPFTHTYFTSGVTLPPPTYYNQTTRCYPDIVANGHTAAIFVDGKPFAVDGTSLSTPTVAGMLVRLNVYLTQTNQTRIGYINPLLYYLSENQHTIFHDLVNGTTACTCDMCCNPHPQLGYIATKGWDPVFGLGSLNFGLLHSWFESQ